MERLIMNKKNIIRIAATGLVCVFALFVTGCGETKGKREIYYDDKENTEETVNTTEETFEEKNVYIQISGAVKNPGVYEVKSGSRIFEVMDLSGGYTEEAATDVVNLARPVKDEMQIYIPTKKEVEMSNQDYFWENYQMPEEEKENSDGRVNLNTATKEELMSLPGIGESKAEAIMDYREKNGGFSDISDIMKISGIKEAAFEKIKELIVV